MDMSIEKEHFNTKAATPIPRLPCKFKKKNTLIKDTLNGMQQNED